LVLNIMTAVSQWEREAIGERTRDAMSHKRTKGERIGNIQFSYQRCADGKHVEPDAAEQAVLEEIRHLRQAGATLRGIAAALNHRGHSPAAVPHGGWSTWLGSRSKPQSRAESSACYYRRMADSKNQPGFSAADVLQILDRQFTALRRLARNPFEYRAFDEVERDAAKRLFAEMLHDDDGEWIRRA
jgi:DNA-binding transcriptional MerR regulator